MLFKRLLLRVKRYQIKCLGGSISNDHINIIKINEQRMIIACIIMVTNGQKKWDSDFGTIE